MQSPSTSKSPTAKTPCSTYVRPLLATANQAATTGGIIIDTRARFGFTAAPGTTDDPRLRPITQGLPPAYAARLFDARAADAPEQQLQDIVAEGLQEIYFKDHGRRAHGLLVDLTDIDYLDVEY